MRTRSSWSIISFAPMRRRPSFGGTLIEELLVAAPRTELGNLRLGQFSFLTERRDGIRADLAGGVLER